MLGNALIHYLTKAKYYFIVLIPIILIMMLSYLGFTKNNLFASLEIINYFLFNHWIEILTISFLVTIILWFFIRQMSYMSLRRLERESEERRRKAEVHEMRFGVHKD